MGLDRPDLMFHHGSVPFDMHTARHGYPTTENAFCLTPKVTHARSRGTVTLRSRDYRDKPKVDPRSFTDPHDMRVMIAGIRKAREIVGQSAMSEWAGEELYPGVAVQIDEQIAAYITATHNTVYHPAGTVRMGAADDAMSPLATVNPNITTMMIGERCADLVAADRRAAAAAREPGRASRGRRATPSRGTRRRP